MKTLVYILLGILLGVSMINFALNAVIQLGSLHLLSFGINAFLAYVCGLLSGKCFHNI